MLFFDTPGTPGGVSIVERIFSGSKQPVWLGSLRLVDTLLILINPSPSNVKGLALVLPPLVQTLCPLQALQGRQLSLVS